MRFEREHEAMFFRNTLQVSGMHWVEGSFDRCLPRKAGRQAVLHQGCMDIVDFPYLDEDKKGGQQSLI